MFADMLRRNGVLYCLAVGVLGSSILVAAMLKPGVSVTHTKVIAPNCVSDTGGYVSLVPQQTCASGFHQEGMGEFDEPVAHQRPFTLPRVLTVFLGLVVACALVLATLRATERPPASHG